MSDLFRPGARSYIPFDEYIETRRRTLQTTLIGRFNVTDRERRDREEELLALEVEGFVLAGELPWLTSCSDGSIEPFEKWAWRQLRNEIFEGGLENEGEWLVGETENISQLWWCEDLMERSLPCDSVCLLLPRAKIGDLRVAWLAFEILCNIHYFLSVAYPYMPRLGVYGLEVHELVVDTEPDQWRLEAVHDHGHAGTIYFDGYSVVGVPPYVTGVPPKGWRSGDENIKV